MTESKEKARATMEDRKKYNPKKVSHKKEYERLTNEFNNLVEEAKKYAA